MAADRSQPRALQAPLPVGGAGGVAPGRIGMTIFLASDLMGFGGLLLAYAVLRVRAPVWPEPALRFDRTLAGVLTLLLLASSGTMNAAVGAARGGRTSVRRWLAATVALGAAFLVGQAIEFDSLATTRHVGLASDHAASTFYVIAGFHGLHVAAGILALLGVARRGARESIEVAALYWQFVDLVWIVIFTVVYLIPVVPRG